MNRKSPLNFHFLFNTAVIMFVQGFYALNLKFYFNKVTLYLDHYIYTHQR